MAINFFDRLKAMPHASNMGKSPNDPRYPNGWHMNDRMPHHDSFEQLWETKWKEPVSSIFWKFCLGDLGIYCVVYY